jgi:TFIIS helical bundle-like domain
MNFATDNDIENNKNGKPGIAKLKIVEKVITKLKNEHFAEVFLDKDGLIVLNRFISRLPDGSWPLSNVRSKILRIILGLPVNLDHLTNNVVGKTIVMLEKSPKELEENKKIIRQIRDKWTRIATHAPVEYTLLEDYERKYNMVHLSMPRQAEEEDPELGKRQQQTEEDLNAGLSYGGRRPPQMGYNFAVRPESNYRGVDKKKLEEQHEVNKLLTRMRRIAKNA